VHISEYPSASTADQMNQNTNQTGASADNKGQLIFFIILPNIVFSNWCGK